MAYALSGYAWRGEKYRVEPKQQRIHRRYRSNQQTRELFGNLKKRALTLIFISSLHIWIFRWQMSFSFSQTLDISTTRQIAEMYYLRTWRERESLNPFRTHICQRRLHFQNEIEEEERKGNNKRRRENYVLKRGDVGIFLINLKGHQLFQSQHFAMLDCW